MTDTAALDLDGLEAAAKATDISALIAENARLKRKNSNMRRALRDLNKAVRGRADAIRSINWVNGVSRADHVLDAYGKLAQRNNELGDALGARGKGYTWPVMLEQVRALRAERGWIHSSVRKPKPGDSICFIWGDRGIAGTVQEDGKLHRWSSAYPVDDAEEYTWCLLPGIPGEPLPQPPRTPDAT